MIKAKPVMWSTDFNFKSTALWSCISECNSYSCFKWKQHWKEKMNKAKDFLPIIKSNLPGSCYVYNSTGHTAITIELYPKKTNFHELYTMEPLESKLKVAPNVPV